MVSPGSPGLTLFGWVPFLLDLDPASAETRPNDKNYKI
jgi:hypothetical protein